MTTQALLKEAREILDLLNTQGVLTSTSSLITRLCDRLEEVEGLCPALRDQDSVELATKLRKRAAEEWLHLDDRALYRRAADAILTARAEEREACAQLVEQYQGTHHRNLAAAIRSRPSHTGEQAG